MTGNLDEGGNMRRLPPWMVGGAPTNATATSNRTDHKTPRVKRKHEPEVTKTKAEKRSKRTVKAKERDSNLHENDSDEPKKAGDRRRERKIREEAKCSDGENQEIILPMADQQDEDLTVDDLLSFAQEYLQSEDQTSSTVVSTSRSSSMKMVDDSRTCPMVQESNIGSYEGTRDATTEDMLDLLLGPLFKKPQQ